MAEERREIEITIKVQCDGYGADITASCMVDQIPGLIRRLKEHHIEPAQTPYTRDAQQAAQMPPAGAPHTQPVEGPAPLCPAHGKPMKASQRRAGEFYCLAKIGTDPATGQGIFCTEKMTLMGATA
jgi:hypothetical protein